MNVILTLSICICMIKIFMGGGVVDGEGVAVKDAWGHKGSFQKHLKQGVDKGKSCS